GRYVTKARGRGARGAAAVPADRSGRCRLCRHAGRGARRGRRDLGRRRPPARVRGHHPNPVGCLCAGRRAGDHGPRLGVCAAAAGSAAALARRGRGRAGGEGPGRPRPAGPLGSRQARRLRHRGPARVAGQREGQGTSHVPGLRQPHRQPRTGQVLGLLEVAARHRHRRLGDDAVHGALHPGG
ncbi:MAG: hypothetical protein AVDCRST_MAG72-132, partial [uncultured Nocardioidaceae bacterium]